MMKKLTTLLTSSALLMAGVLNTSAHADMPNTLNIFGSVGSGTPPCIVHLDRTAVDLMGSPSSMINQNETVKTGANVTINLTSTNSVFGAQCVTLAEDGKISYRVIGTADNADGNVLANTDTSNGAAQGVGIGISDSTYASNIKPLRINQDTIKIKNPYNTISLALVKLNGQQLTSGFVKGSLTIQIERL